MAGVLYVARNSQWIAAGEPSVPFSTANARDQLVLGAYKPDVTTTGVLPGSTLTVVTSPAQLPGGALIGGTTYTNFEIRFVVDPPDNTSTIVFRNCWFRGTSTAPTGGSALVKAWDPNHAPVEFWDCTFSALVPSPYWNGIQGHHFKLYRCDISQVIDGIVISNTVTPTAALVTEVKQCYVHDLHWFAPGTPGEGHSDGSHNDCLQQANGDGLVVQGNNFRAFNHPDYLNTYYGIPQANAALMITPDVGPITGMDVEFGWFAGGRIATVNYSHSGATLLVNVGSNKSNHYERDTADTGIEIIRPTTNQPTIDFGTGGTVNVYTDTNTGPVTVSNGG